MTDLANIPRATQRPANVNKAPMWADADPIYFDPPERQEFTAAFWLVVALGCVVAVPAGFALGKVLAWGLVG